MGVSFRQDVHLYPLYLSLAVDFFHNDKPAEAQQFFQLACDWPRELELEVYKQMWEFIKATNERARSIIDPDRCIEWGSFAFRYERVASMYKVVSISNVLRRHIGPDHHNLHSKLNRQKEFVYQQLWIIHGRPEGDPNYGKNAFYDLCNRTSTMADKLAAVNLYADESRILTWLTRLGPFHLIKTVDRELEIWMTAVSSQTARILRVNRENASLEAKASSLHNSIPIINAVGGRNTIQRLEDKNILIQVGALQLVGLYERQGQPIWRHYDITRKEYTWINADPGDIAGLQRVLVQTDTTKRLAALNRYDHTFLPFRTLEDPFRFRIQLHEFPLQINPDQCASQDSLDQWNRTGNRLQINSQDWAVTLISEGSSSDMWDPGFGHAKLICEGVEDGQQFIMYRHLIMRDEADGYARISVGHYEMGRSQINAKSQTWIRPRRLVERLLESDGMPYLYNQTGNRFLGPNFQENIAKELKIGETQSLIKAQVHTNALKLCPGMAAPLRDRSGGASFLAALIGFPTNDSPFDTFLLRENSGKLPTIPFLPFSTPVKEKPRAVRLVASDLGCRPSSAHDAVIRLISDSGNGVNCLTVQIQDLRRIGIRLPPVNTLIASPNQYISWIEANPGLVSIEEISD